MALGHGFHPYNPDKFGQTSYPNLMGTTSPNPCLPPSKVNWILRNQSTFPVGEELPQATIKHSSLGDCDRRELTSRARLVCFGFRKVVAEQPEHYLRRQVFKELRPSCPLPDSLPEDNSPTKNR